jgi:tetratricopeptide (TPR) repeat protein
LFKLGEIQKAEQDWKEALHANPREAASFSPDRIRIFARDWAWVEAYFGWLEKNAPDRSLLPASRGEVSLRARRYTQAAADFSEAMQRHATLRDLVYYRGMAYLGLGENKKAAEDFREAVQVTNRAHIRRLAGMRLRSIGEAG